MSLFTVEAEMTGQQGRLAHTMPNLNSMLDRYEVWHISRFFYIFKPECVFLAYADPHDYYHGPVRTIHVLVKTLQISAYQSSLKIRSLILTTNLIKRIYRYGIKKNLLARLISFPGMLRVKNLGLNPEF